ncbi:MAG: hypothetical protein MZV63_21625, partial [Marinilabiliales bacterium]|nr:hypothetical protein [Marinilabiliales bacterium]
TSFSYVLLRLTPKTPTTFFSTSIAGEGVQQDVGDQHQPDREEKSRPGVALVWAESPDQPGQQHREQTQHEQGMAEATVIGHVGDRIAVVDDHIEVRQGAEHSAVSERLATLPATEHRTLHAGAE